MWRSLLWVALVASAACQGSSLDTTSANLEGSGDGSGSGSGPGEACTCPDGYQLAYDETGAPICIPPQCWLDDDCLPGDVCIDGVCVDLPDCDDDDDCGEPLICVEGACVQPPCEACPEGYHCEALDTGGEVCAPDGCADDLECPEGTVCDGGTCVDDTIVCDDDADCPSGHCVDLVATDAALCDDEASCPTRVGTCSDPDGCEADADCGEGESCADYVCVVDPPFCETDADCLEGVCDEAAQICVIIDGCLDDSDCPEDEQCIVGACGVVDACESDLDCDGERCVDGACVIDEPCGECGPGEVCDAGVCVETDEPTECDLVCDPAAYEACTPVAAPSGSTCFCDCTTEEEAIIRALYTEAAVPS